MSAIIKSIVTQHAEEAGFLGMRQDFAVAEPHYSLKDLAKLDGRVEAHLDGLRIAGEPGWEMCRWPWGWKNQERFLRRRYWRLRVETAPKSKLCWKSVRNRMRCPEVSSPRLDGFLWGSKIGVAH
jgi:hypothetical protein